MKSVYEFVVLNSCIWVKTTESHFVQLLNCFLFCYRWVSCIVTESKLRLPCVALLQVSDAFEFGILYWVEPEFKCRPNVFHVCIFKHCFRLRVQSLKTSVTQTASFQSLLVCSLLLFLVNVLYYITSSVLLLWFMHLVVYVNGDFSPITDVGNVSLITELFRLTEHILRSMCTCVLCAQL
jgi:hypothetical protein